jgi:hypothetical protein
MDRGSIQNHLRRLHHDHHGSLSDLVKEVAREYGLPKRVVYEEALKMKKEG